MALGLIPVLLLLSSGALVGLTLGLAFVCLSAALIVTSLERANKLGKKPLARIAGNAIAGCEPHLQITDFKTPQLGRRRTARALSVAPRQMWALVCYLCAQRVKLCWGRNCFHIAVRA